MGTENELKLKRPEILDLLSANVGVASTRGDQGNTRAVGVFSGSAQVAFSWGGPTINLGASTFVTHEGEARVGGLLGFGGPLPIPGVLANISAAGHYNVRTKQGEPGVVGRLCAFLPTSRTIPVCLESGILNFKDVKNSSFVGLGITGSAKLLSKYF